MVGRLVGVGAGAVAGVDLERVEAFGFDEAEDMSRQLAGDDGLVVGDKR